MILRPTYRLALERALARNPVVALLGPRQCGKTTLARQILPPDHRNYFDLENPVLSLRIHFLRKAAIAEARLRNSSSNRSFSAIGRFANCAL
jgi:predicted AAA+ superfamily ATPase